jgi:sugar lactone lactonase YvrE
MTLPMPLVADASTTTPDKLWVSDHVAGFCVIPGGTYCVPPELMTSPGQAAFYADPNDPTSGYFFIPDNSSKSRGILRIRLLRGALQTGDIATLGEAGVRTAAVALDGTGNLYYTALKHNKVMRITNPTGLKTEPSTHLQVGTARGRAGAGSIAVLDHTMYLAETAGVTKLALAPCGNGCTTLASPTLGSGTDVPVAVTSDDRYVYVASASNVFRYQPTAQCAVPLPGNYGTMSGVSGLALRKGEMDTNGVTTHSLYVGMDMTAGAQANTGALFKTTFNVTSNVANDPDLVQDCTEPVGNTNPAPTPTNGTAYGTKLTAVASVLPLGINTDQPSTSALWVADHLSGICTVLANTPGVSECAGQPAPTAPGQSVYLPTAASIPNDMSGYLFVPDNSSKSRGVWRLAVTASGRIDPNGVAVLAVKLAGARPNAVAIDPVSKRLYVTSLKDSQIYMVENATGARGALSTVNGVSLYTAGNDAVAIGAGVARAAPTALAVVGDRLFLADGGSLSTMTLANCSSASRCIAQQAWVGVPSVSYLAVDPTNPTRLLVSDGNAVYLATPGTNDPARLLANGFSGVGGIGLIRNVVGGQASGSVLYTADDPTAGTTAGTGRLWRQELPTVN